MAARRHIAIIAGGLALAGGMVGVAAWGSMQGPQPDAVIDVVETGGHWVVEGASTDVLIRNHGATTHYIGPFVVQPGSEVRGTFGAAGVYWGKCERYAPATLKIVVRAPAV
ncbi:MAG: hypothetical protein NT143_02025 [Actinobacteria bacterium]|nr:hypothetical protein [Actinomycetota bacterium]